MGNEQSSSRRGRTKSISSQLRSGMRKLEENELSAKIIDNVCGPILDEAEKIRTQSGAPYAYSDEFSEEDDSRLASEDDTMDDERRRRDRRKASSRGRRTVTSESDSMTLSDSELLEPKKKSSHRGRRQFSEDSESFISEEESFLDARKKKKDDKRTKEPADAVVTDVAAVTTGLSKPLASSFAKRCYFTKAGIGKTTQHYEGLTLTGNVVLMLSSAMKLKGCPTICDEDLRRVEQTYPNQFSRLPDELLLSSGWRRISKYCHFSNKPIPDGVPFFHSKQRCHPHGGYYFLLAASVGMVRPIDVEPLTRDTLVLLETDFPTQCDAAPPELLEDATQWTLVDKFCFFSGGPINVDEDVYYEADFDGNPIYMLAFLSPSLTPVELYKLGPDFSPENPGLQTVAAVEEVENVYELTDRDFDDLKLYHLGPCRALPPYVLIPEAWTKVLPPHFLTAKEEALMRADRKFGVGSPRPSSSGAVLSPDSQGTPTVPGSSFEYEQRRMAVAKTGRGHYGPQWGPDAHPEDPMSPSAFPLDSNGFHLASSDYAKHVEASSDHQSDFKREVEEEGAFIASSAAPMDEALATHEMHLSKPSEPTRMSARKPFIVDPPVSSSGRIMSKIDPPDDEPPSLSAQRYDAPDDEAASQTASSLNYGESTDFGVSPNSESAMSGQNYHHEAPLHRGEDERNFNASGKDYYHSPANQGSFHRHGEYYESSETHESLKGAFPRDPFPGDAFHAVSPGDPPHDPGFSPISLSEYGSPQTDNIGAADNQEIYTTPKEQNTSLDEDENGKPSPDENDFGRQSRFAGSDVSHESNALRGARDVLRKNHQRSQGPMVGHQREVAGPEDEFEGEPRPQPPRTNGPESSAGWETESDHNASSILSGSSGWSDTSGADDRSSRRALILQMAKARMRTGKPGASLADSRAGTEPIAEESSVVSGEAKTQASASTMKTDGNTEIDFAAELD